MLGEEVSKILGIEYNVPEEYINYQNKFHLQSPQDLTVLRYKQLACYNSTKSSGCSRYYSKLSQWRKFENVEAVWSLATSTFAVTT